MANITISELRPLEVEFVQLSEMEQGSIIGGGPGDVTVEVKTDGTVIITIPR